MNKLYDIAEKEHISIDYFPMKNIKACSIPNAIAINPNIVKTIREEKECLAHEMGHQMRNAFYNLSTNLETKERQEERATRWAVQFLIPAEDLLIAFKKGCTEVWQLSEYFDVSEDFIRDTLRIHKAKGNI